MSKENNDAYDLLKRAVDESPIIIENKLHVRDFEQPWESAYDGLIYIGDSAHPVRPTGEGTALAFEDANVLSEVIMRNKNGLCVEALRDYESERYEPVKEISEKIRALADGFYEGVP
uniref:FAD-binding domain-containing protein n=1 Tax=Corethron hystrix TaxID=216773 RepID=A0A7S1BDK5_9STRA|mmetsp:Transcript_23224/g.53064  ORF Transcript_23224/g.53064 Transcript_23224/m.53064 type:complete len:117 (+) Transcript_23224:186-536(+)